MKYEEALHLIKEEEAGYKTLVINLEEAEKSNGFNILELPYSLYKKNKNIFYICSYFNIFNF